jgi:hypothetical protein
MNTLYEGLKTNNAVLILVPSSVQNTMCLGDTTGVIALAQNLKKQNEEREKKPEE